VYKWFIVIWFWWYSILPPLLVCYWFYKENKPLQKAAGRFWLSTVIVFGIFILIIAYQLITYTFPRLGL
jgi:hypothetical protein